MTLLQGVAVALLLVLAAVLLVAVRARAAVRRLFQSFNLIQAHLLQLGSATGRLANQVDAVERRLEALGAAVGLMANNHNNQLVALGDASRELTRRTGEIADQAASIRAAVGLTQAAVWADSMGEYLAPFDWAGAIADAARRRPAPLPAHSFLRRRATGTQPVDLRCADGNLYVVKGQRRDAPTQGRRVFTEHVVSRLGLLIGAPIPATELIVVPTELIARHPDPARELGHLMPGQAHGSRFNAGLGERCDNIMHVALNRGRFAALAILQAWTQFSDRHFLYEVHHPHRVYSTDHDGYFAGGADWTAATLQRAALAQIASDLIETCGLTHAELVAAAAPLHAVTAPQIAEVLATPPDEWGVTPDERAMVCRYLRLRQFHLLALFGPTKSVSHLRTDAAPARN